MSAANTARYTDPGPMARLREVKDDPTTMSVIVQRITDADSPETLKDIARAWKVPAGGLAQWITEDRERSEQYANALRIAADQAALETVRIADAASPETVGVAKVKIQARQWLAGKLSRERFGEMNEVRHTGQVSLIAVLSSMPRGRGIDVTPERVTGVLPAPVVGEGEAVVVEAVVAETSPEKNPPKVPEMELI